MYFFHVVTPGMIEIKSSWFRYSFEADEYEKSTNNNFLACLNEGLEISKVKLESNPSLTSNRLR